VNAPYVFGKDSKLLKWKPKEENSVDFRVQVVTRGSNNNSDMAVGEGKEVRYELFISGNHGKEVYIGDLHPDGTLLNQWKHTSPNGKIIECSYDASGWQFMRYREDKDVPNHSSTYDSIIKSIEDNVEQSELLGLMDEIKRTWKNRENSMNEGSLKRSHVEDDKMDRNKDKTTGSETDDNGKKHKRDDDNGRKNEFSGNDLENGKKERNNLVLSDETDRSTEQDDIGPKEQEDNDESKDEEKGRLTVESVQDYKNEQNRLVNEEIKDN
jgi:mRNA guanylyltransferase